MQRNDCVVAALGTPELSVALTTGVQVGAVSVVTSSGFTTTGDGGLSFNILEIGKRYRLSQAGDSTSTYYSAYNDLNTPTNEIGGFGSFEFTAVATSLFLRNTGAGVTTIFFSIREVVDEAYNDLLLAYYKTNGATSNDIATAEYEFLIVQGATPSSIQDMWMQLLGALGYTGSLSDRLKDFWCIGGGSLVP